MHARKAIDGFIYTHSTTACLAPKFSWSIPQIIYVRPRLVGFWFGCGNCYLLTLFTFWCWKWGHVRCVRVCQKSFQWVCTYSLNNCLSCSQNYSKCFLISVFQHFSPAARKNHSLKVASLPISCLRTDLSSVEWSYLCMPFVACLRHFSLMGSMLQTFSLRVSLLLFCILFLDISRFFSWWSHQWLFILASISASLVKHGVIIDPRYLKLFCELDIVVAIIYVEIFQ